MSDDYEIEYERSCPHCEHSPIHSRRCASLYCDDGYCDENDDDSVNFAPGEVMLPCPECHGTGIERWCPKCGKDILPGELNDHDDEDGLDFFDNE